MIRIILIGTLVVTVVIISLLSIAFFKTWDSNKLTIEQQNFFLEAYKIIGIGFLVALLSVVIPNVLAEAQDTFERFKESRVKYSEAKTAIMYLPEKLTNLNNFMEAVSAVEDAHKKLHLCETYPRELRKHLSWHLYPKTWVDRNYWELIAIRKALHANIESWSQMTPAERLKILVNGVEVIGKSFDSSGNLDNDIWWRNRRKWWESRRKKSLREERLEAELDNHFKQTKKET